MSISEMQACLARLYTDDTFRKLFSLDQNTALDGYMLTDDENAAIQAIDRERLDLFATSLKTKRKKKFRNAYQALFKLDSSVIDCCYERYYQLYPARPNLSLQAELLQFGQFMEETLVTFATLPPFAGELAHYERMIASMGLNWEGEKDDEYLKEKRYKLQFDDRLIVSENVKVETFLYNVATIHEALLDNKEIPEVVAGRYHILFQRCPPTGSRFFGISRGTKALLDLCDGNMTLADIVDKLQRCYSNTSLADSILVLAHQMVARSIIEVFHE